MKPEELTKERKIRGMALRAQRLARKFNKMQFARKAGLSRFTINRIESGSESWTINSDILYLNALK